jgi:hypothetical protein
MGKPEVRKPKPTGFIGKCCSALVVQYEANDKGAERHWLGHQCTKCGNQAPLTTQDLLKAIGVRL